MTHIPHAVSALERTLREIFGARLQSVVQYGLHDAPTNEEHAIAGDHAHEPALIHTLAIVETLTGADLNACARQVTGWHKEGLATPLLLVAHEFERSLDAFPFEFGSILADHVLWSGRDPFEGLAIDSADLRRACEVQARSHLLHLREGYIETGGNADGLAVLIVRSAAPFAALVRSVARLQTSGTHDATAAGRVVERALDIQPGSITDIVRLAGVREIPAAEAVRIVPGYLDAAERLTRFVDGWSGA